MSCKTCNTNCIEAGTRDDQMCSAWTKRDDADMGNYFAKLAKVQTNISGTETAKQTNADRIRAMSDEEMAEFINMVWGNGRAARHPSNGWAEWLKEEAK